MNGDSTPDQLPTHITEVSSYWQPNKGLNILTGVNGSGKTRLLDYIYSYMNDEVTINFQALGTSNVNKLDIKFKNPFIPIPDTFVIISNPIRMYYVPVLWRTFSDHVFQHEVIDKNGMPRQESHLGPRAIELMGDAKLSSKIILPNINSTIGAYKSFIMSKRQFIKELEKLPRPDLTVPEVENESW